MAGLSTAVGVDNRQDTPIRSMLRAMTSSLVKQDESQLPQQRIHFLKADTGYSPDARHCPDATAPCRRNRRQAYWQAGYQPSSLAASDRAVSKSCAPNLPQ